MQIHELGLLFEEVQMKNILGDGKTFPDCIPLRPLKDIGEEYLKTQGLPSFDLIKFVSDNFIRPKEYSSVYKSDKNKSVEQHINDLWEILTRSPERENSSLIPLPHPYVVPGGRFREIYYWDSYFTMLGLKASGRLDLIQGMIDNFVYLIETVGYIPNGNRTYFLGRSQPPFFSLMVKLLDSETKEGEERAVVKYLPAMDKEYHFWMRGADKLSSGNTASFRVVRLPDGSILNRYWDDNCSPRPESFKEDIELAHRSKQPKEKLYRHLRAAAESGWDFSSRWFKDGTSFETIHTTDILPVDLNCLLFHLEKTIAEAYHTSGNKEQGDRYLQLADQRKASIRKYFWGESAKFFFDFDFVQGRRKECLTLAAAFPLFFGLASSDQAALVEETLRVRFLKPGGLITTLSASGQQWDAPNGWAPLQWIAYRGLRNYGFDTLALQLKSNWTSVNVRVYQQTGKVTEKYNVIHERGEGAGGEYPNQDGFGWTNGVLLAMLNEQL